MPRKGRKPRRNSDHSSEEPATPETQSPKAQPQSEPRPQTGTVASAKRALRRASSSSPVSSVKPVEVRPGIVASAKESLTTASAEKATGHNDRASSKPVTPKTFVDSSQAASYASEETVPAPVRQSPKSAKRSLAKPLLKVAQTCSAQIVSYYVLENYQRDEYLPSNLAKGINGESQVSYWIPLSAVMKNIQEGGDTFTAEFMADCAEGNNLRLFLDYLQQRYAYGNCEVVILMSHDTSGPNAKKWAIPQLSKLTPDNQWQQVCESLSKWFNWGVTSGDIEIHSVERSVGIHKSTYTYKIPKLLNVPTPPKASPVPIASASDCVSTTEQIDLVEDDGKPPFYHHIVGLILSDMHPEDLPFATMGTRSQRIMYFCTATGHEFCWVTVRELIRALSPIGKMEVRQEGKMHSRLPLVKHDTKEATEAYYALETLVMYQSAHEERSIRSTNEQHTVPPLLVLMRRPQGTATWSLLTEEYVSGRDLSKLGTFVTSVSFQLPLEDMKYEHVQEAPGIGLPNARVKPLAYWIDEVTSASWFQNHRTASPEEVEHASRKLPEVGVELDNTSAPNQGSYDDALLIAELKDQVTFMEDDHRKELMQLKAIHQAEQHQLQDNLDKMQVGNETLHALIAKLTASIPPPIPSDQPMVMEVTSAVSYEDDQLPHKYTNPHLSMQEEQFIWQYVYAMIHREPTKYNLSDHQLLVRQVADLCVQALHMQDSVRCREAKPNPGKAILHGIKSLPKCLTPEQPELGTCARCGRTSKVRFAHPSVTGTLTDLATDYQELCNVPFCRRCTNTEQLHKLNSGVETASLCLQQDKYVQMPTGITGVDAVKPAPQYSSFENCPSPGRTMKFGVLTLSLEYSSVKTEPKPDPLDVKLTTPGVIPLPGHTAQGILPSSVMSTPAISVEPVANTPTHMSIHGTDIEETKPQVASLESTTKVSWKDGNDIIKHVCDKAQKFVWMPASKSSRTSVEEFAQCVRNVQTLLTKDTRVVNWLSDPATRKRVPLVDLLAEIVQVVAGQAHKFTIADLPDLKERLGHSPDVPLTIDRALYNFMCLFKSECLQMEQCTKYVKNIMYAPGYRTFKRTEEHFRRVAPLSKIIHEQFGIGKPIPGDDQSLIEHIFNALPESTQDGVTSKLRDRANSSQDITLANMSLQYLKEVCFVIEDGKGSSRSPSPYGRANVVTPSFEGGEEESDEYYDDDNSTANLQYSAYNRARSTRVPPRSLSRSHGPRGNSATRGRSVERRSQSPHPSRTGRLKSATTKATLDAIIAFDPTKANAGNVCANCGHEGHIARSCTEAYDAERVKKNIELYVKHKTRNVNAPRGQLHAMCTAMATEMLHDQCGSPPASSAGDTDAEATDPEDSTSDDGEDEDEKRSGDSKRSPVK